MIRVVHIFPHLRPGGAERIVVHLLTHLNRRKFNVSGICLADPCGSDLEAMLAEANVPVQHLGKHPGFDYRMYGRLHRALQVSEPHILHTHVHVLRYVLPYIWYSHFAKTRPLMLHTVHNVAEHEVEPRARFIQRLAFWDGVVPVAVAEEVSLSLSRLYGLKHATVVPNCLPVKRYREPKLQRSEWRRRENFSDDQFLFACVAGLRPQKNHSLLLKAFARCAAQHDQIRLVLAGGGNNARLQGEAERLGIAQKVRFLGVRTDVPDVLAASDAFALASDYEGNPLCIMEAMAAGLPVVATHVGGVPELVSSGLEGFLVPPGNVDKLANAMQQLVLDKGLRKRMGEASTARALAHFDIPIMVQAYERLYNSLLIESGQLGESLLAGQTATDAAVRK